jgi:hypothetical protein
MFAWIVKVAAAIGPLDQSAGDGKSASSGQGAMAWVVGILVVLALCWVGFRKSKRTHLD